MALKEVYDAAEKLIAPKYRFAFRRFVETGEANEEALNYLENDSDAQKTIDMMFNAQSRAFEELGRKLRKGSLESKVRK